MLLMGTKNIHYCREIRKPQQFLVGKKTKTLSGAMIIFTLSQENTYLWRTTMYLAASASAEFFADIALCPMESVKVRIQTKPGWSNTLREGAPIILREEGMNG